MSPRTSAPEEVSSAVVAAAPASARRPLLAVIAVVLAALALGHYRSDSGLRRKAADFMHRFGLDVRRPLDAQGIQFEPAGDLAVDIAVDAALRDVEGNTRSAPGVFAPQETRQLEEAQDLMLQAIAQRPGSVNHLYLLGQVVRAQQQGATRSTSVENTLLGITSWAKPLGIAAAAAPGLDGAFQSLADGYLSNWSELGSDDRSAAPAIIGRAFWSADYVAQHFRFAVSTLGSETAARLLPDVATPLRAALRAVEKSGDVHTAGLLIDRADRAERRSREEDVKSVEERAKLRDIERMHTYCQKWIDEHGLQDFGDREGRAQVARLLALWPDDEIGDWDNDPRSNLVRFLLEDAEKEARPDAIVRAVETMQGVPPAIRARSRVLAGDLAGAADEVRDEPASDSPDWVSYVIAVARSERAQGHALEARRALDRLPASARDGCDVLLERREIARALGDAADLEGSRHALASKNPADPQAGWSPGGELSLCLDPEQPSGSSLQIDVAADAPAVVSFGWDGGRLGTVVIERSASISIPISSLRGRRTFWTRSVAGGTSRPVATKWRPAR